MRFEGAVPVVTGAGQGMGKEVARGLAAEGARVVVAEINGVSGKAAVDEITAAGGHVHLVESDITRSAEIEQLFRETLEVFGGLDILVNNAGTAIPCPLVDIIDEDYHKVIDLNVKALFFCTQAAARIMIPKRRGKIVNFAPISAFVSSSTPNNEYDASKGAVRQLTVSTAAELAPHGINVNAVAPGTILTGLTRRVLDTEEKMANVASKIPLQRKGTPADVARPVLFLCSADADYITGHTLVVDGGRLLF